MKSSVNKYILKSQKPTSILLETYCSLDEWMIYSSDKHMCIWFSGSEVNQSKTWQEALDDCEKRKSVLFQLAGKIPHFGKLNEEDIWSSQGMYNDVVSVLTIY